MTTACSEFAFDTVIKAAVNCPLVDANPPVTGGCVITHDLTDLGTAGTGNIVCKDYDSSKEPSDPASYTLTDYTFLREDTDVNDQACQVLGAVIGLKDGSGNLWKSDATACVALEAAAFDCTAVTFTEANNSLDANTDIDKEFCEQIYITDAASKGSRCTFDTVGTCKLDDLVKCGDVDADNYTVLSDAADACSETHWTYPAEDVSCDIDVDIAAAAGKFKCKEYSSSDYAAVAAPTVKHGETATTQAGICMTLGKHFASDKAWVVNGDSCMETTDCTLINWTDVVWTTIQANVPVAVTECPEYEDDAAVACVADGTTKCAKSPSSQCGATNEDNLKNAIVKCSTKDATGGAIGDQCQLSVEYSDYSSGVDCKDIDSQLQGEDLLNAVETPSTSAEAGTNNAICTLIALEALTQTDGRTAAWVAGSNNDCEAATGCSDVDFSAHVDNLVTFTGYSASEMAAKCSMLNASTEKCTANENDNGCVEIVVAACGDTNPAANSTLTNAIAFCASQTGLGDQKCGIKFDISDSTQYECELKDSLVAKPEDITVAAQYNKAKCAVMGAHFGGEGDAPQNAWTAEDETAETCKLVDSCTEVDWTATDDAVVGAIDGATFCPNVGHHGFYDDGETLAKEGQVTCKAHTTANTCASSMAMYMGAITMAAIAMLF